MLVMDRVLHRDGDDATHRFGRTLVAWKQMLRESCGDGNRCDETLVGM